MNGTISKFKFDYVVQMCVSFFFVMTSKIEKIFFWVHKIVTFKIERQSQTSKNLQKFLDFFEPIADN